MTGRTGGRTGERLLTGVLLCGALGACGSTSEPSAVDRGRQLLDSATLSASNLNDYVCSTCHDVDANPTPSRKTGGALAGVTLRPSFWGGQEGDLLGAINACRDHFMGDNQPLAASDEQARALYAYLQSLEPGDARPISMTIVTTIDPLPRGDAERGRDLYAQACMYCHGSMHDGRARSSDRVPILPEDTIAEHAQYSARVQRLVFIEKIRHGLFLGYGGVMPPFSIEVLSDAEVSDVLEGLGAIGE